RGFRGKAGKAGMKNPERAASRRILHSPLWRLPSAAVRIGLPGNTGTGTCERIRCTICNAGTDEIFPRRSCAEIFRLSPYCLARAIRTAVFRTKNQRAIRGQIKEFGQTRSPLRFFHTFLTRYFRAAVARKYSVCPRIAWQGQSARQCFLQSTSP